MNGMFMFNGGNPFAVPPISVGPISSRYLCFQRHHNLVAIDPVSCATLWVRQDVPTENESFGDEHYIFVTLSPRRFLDRRSSG